MSLKMRVVLKAESQWAIIETEQAHAVFPVTIDGEAFTEAQLKKRKVQTCRLPLLIDLIAEHSDLTAV